MADISKIKEILETVIRQVTELDVDPSEVEGVIQKMYTEVSEEYLPVVKLVRSVVETGSKDIASILEVFIVLFNNTREEIDEELLKKGCELNAKSAKRRFDAYVSAGFDKDYALRLTIIDKANVKAMIDRAGNSSNSNQN